MFRNLRGNGQRAGKPMAFEGRPDGHPLYTGPGTLNRLLSVRTGKKRLMRADEYLEKERKSRSRPGADRKGRDTVSHALHRSGCVWLMGLRRTARRLTESSRRTASYGYAAGSRRLLPNTLFNNLAVGHEDQWSPTSRANPFRRHDDHCHAVIRKLLS